MAVIQVSGVPVGAPSSVTLPLTGRPWADLTLAQTAVPWAVGDRVEVQVQDGPVYQMTVERIGPRGGFGRVKLVGGTGGLGREVSAKYYEKIPAATVVRELLEEVGEVPGEILLPGVLPSWVRAAGPAHEALRAIMMRCPERVWQIAPDGRVHVAVPTWPEHGPALPVEFEDAATGVFSVAFAPAVLAGSHVTLSRGAEELGKRVTRVTHQLAAPDFASPGGSLRTLIGTGDGEDQGVTALEVLAQRAVRWVDYLALYDCEVIRDHGDHTLDLRPLHPLLPELVRVRLVQPIPGTRVKLKAGGIVLLSFQRGDPSRPVVLHYGACELEACEIVTGRGQVIRIDDDRGQVSPEDQRYQRPHVTLQDAAGQSVELWAERGVERVKLTDRAGQTVHLNPATGQVDVTAITTVNVTAAATATVNAAVVNIGPGGSVVLAGGGPPVGRVGDEVEVTITGGSSAGVWKGKITKGSPKVVSG